MRSQGSSKRKAEKLWQPFWSRQHGAYVTLICAWLIACLVSGSSSWLQPVILVFLLTGLNASELWQEKITKRAPMKKRKVLWLWLYSAITGVLTIVLLFFSIMFLYFLTLFIAGGLLFLLASKYRKQKSLPVEVLTFGLFSLAGLMAYEPHQAPQFANLFPLWLLMTIYFSSSIFFVKTRLSRVDKTEPLLFLLISFGVLLFAVGIMPAVLATLALIAIRLLPVLVAPKWFRQFKLKTIGFMEMGFQVLFILSLVMWMV